MYTVPVQAWVSNWGIYVMPTTKTVDSVVTQVTNYNTLQALASTGMNLDKYDYATGKTKQYTLSLVQASLMKNTRRNIALSDISGLSFNLNLGSVKGAQIAWDDITKGFKKTGTVGGVCVKRGTNSDTLEVLSSLDTEKKCYCIDSNQAPKTSGYYNYGTNYWKTYTVVEKVPAPYKLDSKNFPWGLYVSSLDYSINGLIDLDYETLQTIYGDKTMHFNKGDTVFQASTGATGVVNSDTRSKIFGATCANCITTTYDYGGSCDASSSSAETGM